MSKIKIIPASPFKVRGISSYFIKEAKPLQTSPIETVFTHDLDLHKRDSIYYKENRQEVFQNA